MIPIAQTIGAKTLPRYLDPKSDIVFKKIFGEHPDLLKSFLNAVLPLPEDGLIDSLEYLSNEQVPLIPEFKYTIVDVKCRDCQGRVFIVEMQIQWTPTFTQRMLFNTSKAYVKQLDSGQEYHLLSPVYGLGLIASEFNSSSDAWYHHYQIVNVENNQQVIKDLQLVFIELPKFQAKSIQEKKLQVLWLRFLSELNAKVWQVPEEWLTVPEIKKAVHLAEEAAYTPGELESYDKYWDAVRSERTLVSAAFSDGKNQGLQQGLEQGLMQGETTGIMKEKQRIAQKLLASGLSESQIAELTNLSIADITLIKQQIP